jgi:hypothetical protein
LRKQERLLLKKARALSDRKSKVIDEIEADERLFEELAPFTIPPAGSSTPAPGFPPSPAGFSQVSFGSLGRTSPVPISSS